MAESTDSDSPTQQPAEDMHWGFSYLREDIQDIRLEFRGQIQEVRLEFRGQIQEVRAEVQGGRRETQQLREEVRGEIREVRSEMRELRKDIATRFNLTIGAMMTLAVGIAALIKV